MPESVSGKCPQGRTQRLIGVALLGTAFGLVVLRAISNPQGTGALSVTLVVIAATVALAVSGMPQGFTGLFGLFFVATVVFNLGRPVLWLIFRDDSAYDLTFGLTVRPDSKEISDLLLFWCVGIAAFAGGYFAFYRPLRVRRLPLRQRDGLYLRRCFWITFAVVAISIPAVAWSKVTTFTAEGYAGLYASQTTYSLSWLRPMDFLLPALFGLAVLLRESKYVGAVAVLAIADAASGLVVGQRTAVGQWVLVAVWYLCSVRGKRIRKWLLASACVLLVVLFQLVSGWREGYGSSVTLAGFMADQGITFLLPESITELPFPGFHTVLGSVIPLGAVYSALGIGTPADRSLGNYLSSNLSFASFERGYGLGGTFYLELYYASGGVWICYLLACCWGGALLRKWEESSARSNVALLYLCMCVPAIVFLPRGSISAITSQIFYVSAYMMIVYVLTWFIFWVPPRSNAVSRGYTPEAG